MSIFRRLEIAIASSNVVGEVIGRQFELWDYPSAVNDMRTTLAGS